MCGEWLQGGRTKVFATVQIKQQRHSLALESHTTADSSGREPLDQGPGFRHERLRHTDRNLRLQAGYGRYGFTGGRAGRLPPRAQFVGCHLDCPQTERSGDLLVKQAGVLLRKLVLGSWSRGEPAWRAVGG